MNNDTKHLTKFLFNTALECPTKLYYSTNVEYYNKNSEDSFLQSLAEGGYQVGELARIYYSGGEFVRTINKKAAYLQTNKLLKNKNVTIYEPAFMFDNFFIRADIVIKENKRIEIIEVKSKVFDGLDEKSFYNKRNGNLSKNWLPHLYDIAFQKFVIASIYKNYDVEAFLFLPDNNKKASVDHLNMMFPIITHPSGLKTVRPAKGVNIENVGTQLLTKVNVTEIVNKIINDELGYKLPMPFKKYVYHLADKLILNKKIISKPHDGCSTCEFKTDKVSELFFSSGFEECWKPVYERNGYTKEDDSVLTLWNYKKKTGINGQGNIFP